MAEFGQDEDSFHAQLGPIVVVPDETGDLFLTVFRAKGGGGARRFEGDTFIVFPADEVFERRNDLVTRVVAKAQGLDRGVTIYASARLKIGKRLIATWQIDRQIGKGRWFAGENGGEGPEGIAGSDIDGLAAQRVGLPASRTRGIVIGKGRRCPIHGSDTPREIIRAAGGFIVRHQMSRSSVTLTPLH